jgi:hypothetical protein
VQKPPPGKGLILRVGSVHRQSWSVAGAIRPMEELKKLGVWRSTRHPCGMMCSQLFSKVCADGNKWNNLVERAASRKPGPNSHDGATGEKPGGLSQL